MQVFRSGSLEAASADLVGEGEGGRYIPSVSYEADLIQAVRGYLQSLQSLGATPPVLAMLTLFGVKGASMAVRQMLHFAPKKIDRDLLVIPDILIEDLDCDVEQTLRPAFDMVWNACGFQRSFNYNDQGEWGGQ